MVYAGLLGSAPLAFVRVLVTNPAFHASVIPTLRQALARVDVLGEAVGQLCEYMQSLKIKEVRWLIPPLRPSPRSSSPCF